jgi:segregation and condensation protein B
MAKIDRKSKEDGQNLSLEAQVETLLFVAPGTVSVRQLAQALEESPRSVEKAINVLEEDYESRGLRILRHKGELRLASAPHAAQIVERFLDLEATARLSTAALECLALVSYQQPITRPQIDSIRGVNSDSVLRNLLSNGLVEEAGRAEGPGRPILYVTAPEFLQHFGLSALEDLPPLNLEAVEADSSEIEIPSE